MYNDFAVNLMPKDVIFAVIPGDRFTSAGRPAT
jgi:hypothetical protein